MRSRLSLLFFVSVLTLSSCSSQDKKSRTSVTDTLALPRSGLIKPPSSYQDTFHVHTAAAIFYSPDSLQLARIGQEMDKGVFEATMHEYDNQFRVSHIELKENWKQVVVHDLNRYRYIQFHRKDGRTITIDLNTKGEPCGLYAFDPQKDPQLMDMMNIGTQLYYYFHQ